MSLCLIFMLIKYLNKFLPMFKELSDKDFLQKLKHIKPSRTYNHKLLAEIEKRNLTNNLIVVNYLHELSDLRICTYKRQEALLNQIEISDRSNKFVAIDRHYEEFTPTSYDIKKVICSLKNRRLSKDFSNFTDNLEKILESTKTKTSIKEEDFCIIKIQTNHKVILDFATLSQKFVKKKITVNKLDLALLQDLQNGSLSFREAWFDVFRGPLCTTSILFVFYFICLDNSQKLKYQILKNMIKDQIGGIDLQIFEETNARYKLYLENNILSREGVYKTNKGLILDYKEEKEQVLREQKASEDVLKWYKERETALTQTKD